MGMGILNSGFSGASSGGVMSEMIALGAMEAFLVKGATVSFFRFRYSRHTNFAMEPVFQTFQNQPAFGREAQCTFARTGDMVYHTYVLVQLPAIQPCNSQVEACTGSGFTGLTQFPSLVQRVGDAGCSNYVDPCVCTDEAYWANVYADPALDVSCTVSATADLQSARNAWLYQNYGARDATYDPAVFSELDSAILSGTEFPAWVHWHNAVGQKVIKRAALIIGGHVVDTLYSDYLYMWEELSGKAGKRLREMIGKRTSRRQLIADAAFNQSFWVPLPFSYTQHSGNVLSLVSLQYHGVVLHVDFEQLQNLVVTSSSDVTVVKSVDFSPLSPQDLYAVVDTTYVYLDLDERDRFATANYDQLITQVQVLTAQAASASIDVNITFNHPVIELIWAARRACMALENNSFNFSGKDKRDPIDQVSLLLNNMPRWQTRPGQYFRLVQPYQHHSHIPEAHIYSYSFALHPEEPQPTGSCNFSRIDNAHMIFDMQQGLELEQVQIIIFARNHQILRFVEGVGGSLFAA